MTRAQFRVVCGIIPPICMARGSVASAGGTRLMVNANPRGDGLRLKLELRTLALGRAKN